MGLFSKKNKKTIDPNVRIIKEMIFSSLFVISFIIICFILVIIQRY